MVTCPHCGMTFTPTAADTPVAQARATAGLTVKQVSYTTGISIDEIRRIERGVSNPRLGSVKKLAALYGKTVEELFPDPDEPAAETADERDDYDSAIGLSEPEVFLELDEDYSPQLEDEDE